MICQRRVFLLNNVYFNQKLVSLYSYPSLSKRLRNLLNQSLFTTIPKSSCLLYQQPTFPVKRGKSVWLPRNHAPIPSLMTDKGTFFALAALAHE